MQLQYQQDSGTGLTRSYGFKLWDRNDRFTLAQMIVCGPALLRVEMAKKERPAVRPAGKCGR